jgi:hypothetical protein
METVVETLSRSSWGLVLARASHGDVSLLFLLLVLVCAAVGVYFVAVRNYIGAGVAVFIAILIAIFLL